MSEVKLKPWFNTWLRGLRTYCAVMGEPVPSTFRQAFKLYPPPTANQNPENVQGEA